MALLCTYGRYLTSSLSETLMVPRPPNYPETYLMCQQIEAIRPFLEVDTNIRKTLYCLEKHSVLARCFGTWTLWETDSDCSQQSETYIPKMWGFSIRHSKSSIQIKYPATLQKLLFSTSMGSDVGAQCLDF